MFRTESSVGMLKAIALIAGLAILLWSLGLPSLKVATAAALNTLSDTVTDSAPSASANHTISFIAPSGVAAAQTITVTFPAGYDLSSIVEDDIDLEIDGSDALTAGAPSGATWGVGIAGQVITITSGTGTIGSASTTVIKIGTHADGSGTGANQIANPASEASYEIDVVTGSGADSGTTHNVVMNTVLVTVSVDTVFTFAVAGVGTGVSVNGVTTSGTTTTTTIPFGKLVGGAAATTTAQRLTVNTNASQGYVVTVQSDGELESTTGGIIDPFTTTDTPASWTAPTGDVDDATTWGHWGVTSDDATTTRAGGDEFNSAEFVGASTTPRVVMSHDGPVNGTGTGVGTTYVGYQIAITNLQEAGDDYSTVLTYIATPTF